MAGLRSSWYSARLARRDLTLRPVDALDLCITVPCHHISTVSETTISVLNRLTFYEDYSIARPQYNTFIE